MIHKCVRKTHELINLVQFTAYDLQMHNQGYIHKISFINAKQFINIQACLHISECFSNMDDSERKGYYICRDLL